MRAVANGRANAAQAMAKRQVVDQVAVAAEISAPIAATITVIDVVVSGALLP